MLDASAPTSPHRRCCLPLAVLALGSAALLGPGALHATKARPGRAPDIVEIVIVPHGPAGRTVEKPIIAGSGEVFRDCADTDICPDLVLVPSSRPGQMIGSPVDEPGRRIDEPLQPVRIETFAIGRGEVTVAEFARCVTSGVCRSPGAADTTPDKPVANVSHADAEAYVAWLSTVTGQPYRLPSEAEWEHAARAGTTTPYWWTAAPPADGKPAANCNGCSSIAANGAGEPAPASQMAANPWGIVNANGNVWEWTADHYCDSYAPSPADGTPRLSAACPDKPSGKMVLRGGSYTDVQDLVRAAARTGRKPVLRAPNIGFRVARQIRPRRP